MLIPWKVYLVPRRYDEWYEFGDCQPPWFFLVDLDQYIAVVTTWWENRHMVVFRFFLILLMEKGMDT